MTMSTRIILLAALPLAAVACGDSDSTTGPEGDAVVTGRVEGAPPAAATEGPARQITAADASTAVVSRVATDGSLSAVAEAEVEADGSYRVEGVPTGETGLVVVARTEAEAEVGRVIVYAETEADVETRVAPIDASTTVRGRAFTMLRARGEVEGSTSGSVAAWSGFSASADGFVASDADVVADAVADASGSLQVAAARFEASFDGDAWAMAMTEAAASASTMLDAGGSAEGSSEVLVNAAVDAMVDQGLEADGVALAMIAAADAHVDAEGSGSSRAALDLARQRAWLVLEARERLATEAEGDLGASGVASVLAEAQVAVLQAETAAEVEAEVDAAATSSWNAIVTFTTDASSSLDLATRTAIEGALATLAALSLEGSFGSTAESRADAAVQFRSDVQTSVDTIVSLLGSSSVDADAMARWVVASRASFGS